MQNNDTYTVMRPIQNTYTHTENWGIYYKMVKSIPHAKQLKILRYIQDVNTNNDC